MMLPGHLYVTCVHVCVSIYNKYIHMFIKQASIARSCMLVLHPKEQRKQTRLRRT